jgi:ComF family protein
MPQLAGALCSVCGERLLDAPARSEEGGPPMCGLCLRCQPWFHKAVAYGSYAGGLRELIHLLKYDRVRPAARVLGRMLADAVASLAPDFGEAPLLMVPVPLHAAKLRQRGFNQAELIARSALKLKPGDQFVLENRVLERHSFTQSQTGLTSQRRRENVRGAFTVLYPERVAKRQVLLVDDVFATGSTVSECARILRGAGASKVWVATVARTLKGEAQGAELPESVAKDRLTLAAAG